MTRKKVVIYTDGYCQPNPGRGGWGAVLEHGDVKKELSGGATLTTNNRMELLAVIEALVALKFGCQVDLYSDSRYVVERLTVTSLAAWYRRRAHNAQTTGASFPNADLWARMIPLMARHAVAAHWVKGHSGVEGNERCDRLALEAAQAAELPADPGYVATAPAPVRPPPAVKGPKIKITAVGQPCRKCATPVVKRIPRKPPPGAERQYTYAFYLLCPACRTMYMVEEAKVMP